MAAVAGEHPDLAFDFAVRNRARVEAFVDASSRSRYFAALAGGSAEPAMIDKLEDYARRHMNAQSRGAVEGPTLISVPMWVYRGLFFAWALWMAFALVRWLRWAFNAWKSGGLWRGEVEEA